MMAGEIELRVIVDKLRSDFEDECDRIKILSDRLDIVEGFDAEHTHSGYESKIEQLNSSIERLSSHVHAQVTTHKHLGVENALDQLKERLDSLADEIQAVKENIYGADEGGHSSYINIVENVKRRMVIAEALAKQAMYEIDELKSHRGMKFDVRRSKE